MRKLPDLSCLLIISDANGMQKMHNNMTNIEDRERQTATQQCDVLNKKTEF